MTNYNDLTKEQLIAELQSANATNKYLRESFERCRIIEYHARSGMQLSPQELSARLAIAEARLAVFEEEKAREKKKQEFDRKLAEVTDFLKANGYKVEKMTMGDWVGKVMYDTFDAAKKAAEPKLKS
jgi:ribosome-binding protein aMBF1 (putative translation factor)